MRSRQWQSVIEWSLAFTGLGLIVIAYRHWLHTNPTTVALTLLLYILLLAARLRLQHAVAVSLFATAAYNFFFLPPVDTFTIADPQNWLALFAFLTTSVIGSRLSQKAKEEARSARTRQSEMESLFALSRDLLLIESLNRLLNTLPTLVRSAARADGVVLFLLDGDRIYQDEFTREFDSNRERLRQLALSLSQIHKTAEGSIHIPVMAGVKPRGLLILWRPHLSLESNQAVGSLVSIAIDRAQALEAVAKSEASKANERLRSLMLDSVTHELRTPLTSIKGASTTLLSSDQLAPEERRELASIIDEEADRLNRLVSRAVEMAQIESGDVHLHLQPADVEDLVRDTQRNCPLAYTTHSVTVELPELPKIMVDTAMMAKVLCNLIENAAKYSEPLSPILITGEVRDGFLHTSISDRGIGIDESEQGLIFDRLYRSRSIGGRIAGSGMGLAISRAIVESHHGKLTVTSQPGRGSVFTVSLPV